MKQDSWEKPSSFAETVRLVEDFVKQEVVRETDDKQLYYHTIDHAIAVKRRANTIFQAIKSTSSTIPAELNRLESLIKLCALAHDMVQQFSLSENSENTNIPRQRTPGVSETATVKKLFEYIENLNQTLLASGADPSIIFSDQDLAMIEDAILATVCDLDPQAGKTIYSFSAHSIYQPYLYDSQPRVSIIGKIIALSDLGTLGIDGVDSFITEGILVFIEDNLDLKNLILNCDYPNPPNQEPIRIRLLNMTRFIVSLARERKARFELEIAGFNPKLAKFSEKKFSLILIKKLLIKFKQLYQQMTVLVLQN